MVERTTRYGLWPGLMAVVLALAVGVWVYVSSRPVAPPAPDAHTNVVEARTYATPPLAASALPTPTPPPVAPPAALSVRVLPAEHETAVPPTRLVWTRGASETLALPIPAGGALDTTLPPGQYLFRIESDAALCLEARNLLLKAGETTAATFSLVPAATLEIAIAGRIREGVPPGAHVIREPVLSGYDGMLPLLQPTARFYADAQGRVQLTHLRRGAPYQLIAAATGFLPQSRTLVAGEVDAVTFYLTPGGLIAGRVLHEATGGAVEGLSLRLWGHGIQPAVATTDASGSFTFDGLWPGEYSIDAATTAFGVLTDGGTPMPIAIRLGEHREDVLLYLGHGGSIRVRLIDARTGEPFDAALLKDEYARKYKRVDPWSVPIALTAPDGQKQTRIMSGTNELIFSSLADGEYLVELQGTSSGHFTNQMRCATVADGAETLVDFPVWDGRSISGTVVDPAGAPVEGATVETHDGKRYQTVSDATGSFCLTGVELSTYTVVAECTGYAPGYAQSVPAGRKGLVLRLGLGGTLDGSVLDKRGAPASGVPLRCEQQEVFNPLDLFHGDAVSDRAGHFRWEHLMAGCYLLEWHEDGLKGQRLVDIRDGETTRVVLGGGVALVGTVRVDGHPADGWMVAHPVQRVANAEEDGALDEQAVAKTACDAEGRYRLAGLPAGRHGWIGVVHQHAKFAYPVEVEFPKQGEKTLDIEFSTSTLMGRVVDGNGLPVADCKVRMAAARLGPAPNCAFLALEDIVLMNGATVATDARGEFQIESLPPGQYVLASWDPAVLAPQKVECGPSGGRVDVELRAETPGILEGRVFFPVQESMQLLAHNEEGVAVVATDIKREGNAGAYRCTELPPGRYDLCLFGGHESVIFLSELARGVEIESGQTTRRDFVLKACSSAVVQVWDGETGGAIGDFVGMLRPKSGVRLEECGILPGILNSMILFGPPGRYALKVEHPDYRPGTVEFEMPEPQFSQLPNLFVPVRLQPRH